MRGCGYWQRSSMRTAGVFQWLPGEERYARASPRVHRFRTPLGADGGRGGNQRADGGLELVGLVAQTGGTSSAAYVRWPDGRECALTRSALSLHWMRRSAALLSMARAEGLPVPRHDLVIEMADGRLAVIQERLPGWPPDWVDASRIEAIVEANSQFAGFLAGRPEGADLPMFLQPGGTSDRVRRRALEMHANRSRRLLRKIEEIERIEVDDVPEDDLVHPDYGLGNVLFDARGEITGIIDWNDGATRGDHRFALLKLGINVEAEGDQYGVQPGARRRLDAMLQAMIDPTLLRRYWAQWSLCAVSHAILHGFPVVGIDREIRLGEDRLA